MANIETPPIVLSNKFPYQSACGYEQLSYGFSPALQTSPILEALEEQVTGYAISLHPNSQTPVAVKFKFANGVESAVYVLAPGEYLQPGKNNPFASITWGLPFGWLGGGLAKLMVYTTLGAKSLFGNGGNEIVIQRLRVGLHGDTDALSLLDDASRNWPNTFPSKNIQYDRPNYSTDVVTTQKQGGDGFLAVTQTRALARIAPYIVPTTTGYALTSPLRVRLIWYGTDDFDTPVRDTHGAGTQLAYGGTPKLVFGASVAADLNPFTPNLAGRNAWGTYTEIEFPANVTPDGGAVACLIPPMISIPGTLLPQGGDEATLRAQVPGMSEAQVLALFGNSPAFIDIVRYGKL